MTEAAPALPRSLVGMTLLLLTVLLGNLNAVKPLHMDDSAYFYFARQIAAHPLDPYGFSLMWYQEPYHANQVLAPPVVPYTWALGLRLFGDRPDACKLLLLPWVFLLVYAVYSLARRFAAGLELPLTILTILSPALWPSLNFMLDIPALGLALTAIALFLRACDDDSFFQAAGAGLIAGLAFETKYTACVAVAVFAWAALLRRRWGLGFMAVLLAGHVFLAWEFLIAVLYGRSHFFLTLASSNAADGESLWNALQGLVLTKGPLATSLLSLLGGLTPALMLLGLMALGVRRRWLILTTVLFLSGLVLIALFDSHLTGIIVPSPRFFGAQQTPPLRFELADVIFAVFGGGMLLVTAMIAYALLRSTSGPARRDTVFLLGWLVLELAAFFPLTPFPAARRVLGIVLVLALLVGRYAAKHYCPLTRRRTLTAIVSLSVLLGLGFFLLDTYSATVQRDAANQAAEWIREHGGGRMWFTGHWGFQYYAEHHGMQAVIPDYTERPGLPSPTRLTAGDWLVIPDEIIDQQTFQLDPDEVREVVQLTFDDPIPLRTVWSFYGSPDPIQHQEGPRLQVRIYRVVKDFLPRLPATPLQ